MHVSLAFSPVLGIQSGRMALKWVGRRRNGVTHEPNMSAHPVNEETCVLVGLMCAARARSKHLELKGNNSPLATTIS